MHAASKGDPVTEFDADAPQAIEATVVLDGDALAQA